MFKFKRTNSNSKKTTIPSIEGFVNCVDLDKEIKEINTRMKKARNEGICFFLNVTDPNFYRLKRLYEDNGYKVLKEDFIIGKQIFSDKFFIVWKC